MNVRPMRRFRGATTVLVAVTVAGSLLVLPPARVAAGGAPSFSDVGPGHPFATEIGWVADEGIAEGYEDGTFRPLAPVSRQAMVAFLYRAYAEVEAGDPPTATFPDVPPTHPFFTEVEWAVAEGIVEGYDDGTFRPAAAVSRAATAAFLFRAEGSPAGPHPSGGFPDVPAGHPFRAEISWLAQAGVTNGLADCRFGVTQAVSRQAMAAMLYRLGTDQPPPRLRTCAAVTGLDTTWDLGFTPNGTMVFTERNGPISVRLPNGTVRAVFADLGDLYDVGETGLMGIAIDPSYASNRRFYTCQGVGAWPFAGIQVVAWQMNTAFTAAVRTGVLVGPNGWGASQNGRHGGCRLRIGEEGALWISTGDAAVGTNPQDLTRLNGKVLRVSRLNGQGYPGNPFIGSANANTRRIYTYGHRNAQGLAERRDLDQMWSVEQGTFQDDEVNLLVGGGNYGWDPVPGYDESTPMTDLVQFPAAQPARWESNNPTIATSGATWIDSPRWGAWDGALVVACLKNQELRVMQFEDDGTFVDQEVPSEADEVFGRLRQPVQGPDGILYVAGNGRITQIVPVGAGPT